MSDCLMRSIQGDDVAAAIMFGIAAVLGVLLLVEILVAAGEAHTDK